MRAVDGADLVSIRIDEKLVGFTPNTSEYSCIFRVHTQLRNVNEKAYEPELLAIGPYHRGKVDLRQMEEHKLRYLQLLLQRRNESSVERYIKAMRELEGRARRFYAETISLTTDEFVEMLLLDGCFIIELFRKFKKTDPIHDECDPIFRLDWMFYSLTRDLMLFENQIPSFVLTKLFEMTEVPNEQDHLINLAMFYLEGSLFSFGGRISKSSYELRNSRHLLALLHKSVTPPYVEISTGKNVVEWNSIPSATELQEAGVKFKKLETGGFLEIKFNINGVMEIPPLKIGDVTESMFRNLVAYEQYSPSNNPKYFTEYMNFMDYLINSPKDVELLRRRGIIENWLGDDEAVSTMFNKLNHCVVVSNFRYAQIFRDVNKYCRRRQNVWIAKLRHNYFNSPWALISFLAAAFLLILALTQSIFTVLAYFVPRK
ncbi:UPF0481 protein At3g47200-like [Corylus avellana]|uniref:UPF0481 protein At3g47200-like n=1 Tax=Corylus avellana TaxID=13451 RepID=UPI001E20549F|nr:UPF0481 protein At3g47200-like [Corylus avellana]XP_059447890.1 UPF0481 protein At3g47200-like [Corylus avellana]